MQLEMVVSTAILTVGYQVERLAGGVDHRGRDNANHRNRVRIRAFHFIGHADVLTRYRRSQDTRSDCPQYISSVAVDRVHIVCRSCDIQNMTLRTDREVRNVQRLCKDIAAHRNTEELSEIRDIYICSIKGGFLQILSGATAIVVLR